MPFDKEENTFIRESMERKYNEERLKRLRPEGNAQYIDLDSSSKFKHLASDPWTRDPPYISRDCIKDGGRCEFLIVGAGFTGLLIAARLVESGISPDDIRLVDAAAGFGGTWYWNRYPGLMCDVESYIYMPLLEEMAYMPRHKYSYGPELRRYAELVAEKYRVTDKALFGYRVTSMIWNDQNKDWIVQVEPVSENGTRARTFRAHFIMNCAGLLNWPKIPKIPGLHEFKGHVFHTSRWDYNYTGGSEDDQKLTNLTDKSVAILGTGATAIQIVPELAKYAKHVYIIQRTPSAVDRRDQRVTDEEWWGAQTSQAGWQAARRRNFNSFITDAPENNDLVNDGWTNFRAYAALAGTPKHITPEMVPEHVSYLMGLDAPRSERVRNRVDEIVEDKKTAERLKAWYHGWCKRPCFHDEYLQSFNMPHVTLIDTQGKGIESLTTGGFTVAGREYPIDLLVLSTGYQPPLGNNAANYAHANILGRNSMTLEKAWESGPHTMHGVSTHGFPNLFFFTLTQAGLSPNFIDTMDTLATHVAYMISHANSEYGGAIRKDEFYYKYPFTVEPTIQAQTAWTSRVVELATAGAAMINCTPGYFNQEGELDKLGQEGPRARLNLSRSAVWGKGLEDFAQTLEIWRASKSLKGLRIQQV